MARKGYVSPQLPNLVPICPFFFIDGVKLKLHRLSNLIFLSMRLNLARFTTVSHVPVNAALNSYPANEDPKKN